MTMAMEQTIDKLYEMRMTTMARAYREQREAPGIDELSFDERLAMIVDAEWDSRRANKRQRLLRQANFSAPDASVLDVRYDIDRKLDRNQITELANCTWIKERRNLIITGATGSGKTWLACALGIAACNQFHTVRYARLPEMLDDLLVSKDAEWLKAKMRYIKCDLLIIDDWLLEKVGQREAREILEIIEARQRQGSVLLCSQFSPGGWHAKLGESAIADAVIDRLVYSSYTIHVEGTESMRKRMSNIK